MSKLLFESVVCSRCGGAGRLPFSVYGGICFKCNGKGEVLTKRGRAAQNFLDDLRHRPVEDVKVGDLVLFKGFSAGSYSEPSRWHTVTEVQAGTGADFGYRDAANAAAACYRISTTGGSLVQFAGSRVRIGLTAEQKREYREAALAYQATLTKAGTPSRRAQEAVS